MLPTCEFASVSRKAVYEVQLHDLRADESSGASVHTDCRDFDGEILHRHAEVPLTLANANRFGRSCRLAESP